MNCRLRKLYDNIFIHPTCFSMFQSFFRVIMLIKEALMKVITQHLLGHHLSALLTSEVATALFIFFIYFRHASRAGCSYGPLKFNLKYELHGPLYKTRRPLAEAGQSKGKVTTCSHDFVVTLTNTPLKSLSPRWRPELQQAFLWFS